MLDMKVLRGNVDEIKKKLQHRGEDLADLDKFEQLDQKRREMIVQSEQLKNNRNEVSERIAQLKKKSKMPII